MLYGLASMNIRTLAVANLATALCLSLGLSAGAAHAQPATDADFDDLMGGFDDDFGETVLDEAGEEMPRWLAGLPFAAWLVDNIDLSGSISTGAVYSYLDHKVPHGDEAGRSTSYGNLTRLDLDGFLQLDIRLPGDWKIRAEGRGWYDFVYRIKGRGNYGGGVLDVYEWQIDTGEVYLTGPLYRNVDLTLGRKIVNWGRSDTLRVVDVINPLDNKEPGLVDIEDLRRPRTMLKLDANHGPWSAQFLVVTENRYNRDPPPGSDFFIPGRHAPINDRSNFSGTPGLAGKLDARFSGWDLSLYGAYVDEPGRVIDLDASGASSEGNRFGLFGTAGNWTRGPWLLKFEVAWLTKIRIPRFRRGDLFPSSGDSDRIDSMIGVEFYGRDDFTIALEIVNRHLLNQSTDPSRPRLTPRSRFETALRISRPFFRERLKLTALAVGFGERLQHGGIVRLFGDFELSDAWKAEAGILIFIGGPDPGLGGRFDSNDRLYARIKYSF